MTHGKVRNKLFKTCVHPQFVHNMYSVQFKSIVDGCKNAKQHIQVYCVSNVLKYYKIISKRELELHAII
jgi:hypothetical protein